MFTPHGPVRTIAIEKPWHLWLAHVNNSLYLLIASGSLGLFAAMVTGAATSQDNVAKVVGVTVFVILSFFALRFVWTGGFVRIHVPTAEEIREQEEVARLRAEEQIEREADAENGVAGDAFFQAVFWDLADTRLGTYFGDENVPEQYRLVSLIRFIRDVMQNPNDQGLQVEYARLAALPHEPENQLSLLRDLYLRLF